MLSLLRSRLSHARDVRSRLDVGISLAEVMVAVLILTIVMTASAWGMTTSFQSAANMENRAKATQLAQDVVAQAQQSPWNQLYISTASRSWTQTGAAQCGSPTRYQETNYGYVPAPASGVAPFPGLEGCQTMKFQNGNSAGVGVTFYVTTHIVYVRSQTGFDSSPSQAQANSNLNYAAKRVYVNVRWRDVGSSGSFDEFSMAYTRTPSFTECVPTRVTVGAGQFVPDGCVRT